MRRLVLRLRQHGFLLLVCAAWALPPLLSLARRAWTSDQGAQGPLIMCTGLWALARETRRHPAGSPARGMIPVVLGFGMAVPLYILAGVVGAVSIQVAATHLGLVTLLYALAGPRKTLQLWFPLLYLAFLIPPPAPIVTWLTASLRLWVSGLSVDLLAMTGLEVAHSGNTLVIDGYELLVEAACSGLNSIVSLLAVGLFYGYVRECTRTEAVLLGLLIVPIAILANLVRVMLLLVMVHLWGADVLATYLHEGAGFLMFFVALAGLYIVDRLLSPLVHRWRAA